jgi:hypothetical protein
LSAAAAAAVAVIFKALVLVVVALEPTGLPLDFPFPPERRLQ